MAQPLHLNQNSYQISTMYIAIQLMQTRVSISVRLQKLILSLQNLKVSKATGLDGIPAKLLKLSYNVIAPSLTYIFNLSISAGAQGEAQGSADL